MGSEQYMPILLPVSRRGQSFNLCDWAAPIALVRERDEKKFRERERVTDKESTE